MKYNHYYNDKCAINTINHIPNIYMLLRTSWSSIWSGYNYAQNMFYIMCSPKRGNLRIFYCFYLLSNRSKVLRNSYLEHFNFFNLSLKHSSWILTYAILFVNNTYCLLKFSWFPKNGGMNALPCHQRGMSCNVSNLTTKI